MADDLARWRLLHAGGDRALGRGMKYFATAPGCANQFHKIGVDGCACRRFDSAFAARLHIRDANLALDGQNNPPAAS